MKRGYGVRLASGLLALTLCLGCAGERRATRPEGVVVISTLSDISGINPLLHRVTAMNRDLMRILFLQLLTENPDFRAGPPTFEPSLAESYEFSENRLRLEFRLRRDVVWSDGVPVTAHDVRWTWQAQIDPAVAWAYVAKKEAISDVEVVDDHTVVFHFTRAYPGQLFDANEGWILPRHAWGQRPFEEWREDAGWFVETIVSSGPFTLEAWESAHEIRLAANELFHEEGRPRLDKVIFRVVPDKLGEINHLLGGSVDYVKKVPNDQVKRVLANPDLELDRFWGRQYNFLTWNLQKPPFGQVEVRRALTHAIDRDTIVETLYGDRARVSVSPVLTSAWAFHDGLEAWPFDPEESRRLLRAAGFSDRDGDGIVENGEGPFSFELAIDAASAIQRSSSTMIQEQLRKVGVEARIRALEFNTWVEHLTSGRYEASIGGWDVDTSFDVGFAFHSDEAKGYYNFGRYANPEVDRLIDEANLAEDVDEKRRLLRRLQEILHEDQPYTFLWEMQEVNARSRRVRGSAPNALTAFYRLGDWWVDG